MVIMSWMDRIPMLVVFAGTIGFVFLSIIVGMRLNAFMKKEPEEGESVGSVVGATLGLLAFMLAFTFSMTASRFDMRNQLLMDEVSAIGTAYLRAGFLPQPFAANVRELLREYVDVRARGVREPETLLDALTRSQQIHEQLWSDLEKMTAIQPATITQSLFIQSLNEVIDLHGKRVTVGLQLRIPIAIWLGLYSVAALSMIAVGYQFGQSHRRQLLFSIVLAMAFSSVILLIIDLDRSWEGVVKVNQQPLYDLEQSLHKSSF